MLTWQDQSINLHLLQLSSFVVHPVVTTRTCHNHMMQYTHTNICHNLSMYFDHNFQIKSAFVPSVFHLSIFCLTLFHFNVKTFVAFHRHLSYQRHQQPKSRNMIGIYPILWTIIIHRKNVFPKLSQKPTIRSP